MAPALFAIMFVLLPAAYAGDPPGLCLPTSEAVAAWAAPAERAGLRVTACDDAPRVEIQAGVGGWGLRAVGADGRVRTATIPAPRSLAEREDAALLAASLLRRSTVTGLVDWTVPVLDTSSEGAAAGATGEGTGGRSAPQTAPQTAPQEPPVASRVARKNASAQLVRADANVSVAARAEHGPVEGLSADEPGVASGAAEPADAEAIPFEVDPRVEASVVGGTSLAEAQASPDRVAIPEVRVTEAAAPVADSAVPERATNRPPKTPAAVAEESSASVPASLSPPPPKTRLHAWAALSPALILRPHLEPAASVGLAGGLGLGPFHAGLLGSVDTNSLVPGAGEEARMRAAALGGTLRWQPDLRIAPWVCLAAGGTFRNYLDAEDVGVGRSIVGWAGGGGGVALRIGGPWSLAAGGTLASDLVVTEVYRGDAPGEQQPLLRAGVTLDLFFQMP